MDKSKNNKKDFGISLLRIILSFMVVVDHLGDHKINNKYKNILYYHIPTFFLISFYYTAKKLISIDINKIKLRFKRLIFPYFVWNIISFILNIIYHYYFNRKCPYRIYDLLIGLLSGRVFILALWFQNVLIFTTLISTIIILLFKSNYLLIFQLLMILSYRFQYSGENYKFFKKHYENIYSLTYGRFIDTFPCSMTGIFIASFKIKNKLDSYKFRCIFLCILFLIFSSKYNFDSNLLTFRYGGLRLNIASCCIFFLFLLSFESIKNNKIIKIIDILSKYTAGIYFIHLLVGKSYIIKFVLVKKINIFFRCIDIYIISYIICFLLDKIFGNTIFGHLIK